MSLHYNYKFKESWTYSICQLYLPIRIQINGCTSYFLSYSYVPNSHSVLNFFNFLSFNLYSNGNWATWLFLRKRKIMATDELGKEVLVSDWLSDPQKNSSITCGFPFLLLLVKVGSVRQWFRKRFPALYSRVQTVFQIFWSIPALPYI